MAFPLAPPPTQENKFSFSWIKWLTKVYDLLQNLANASRILTAEETLDFGSISSNGTAEMTVTIVGAVVGEAVFVGPPSTIESGLTWCAYVSATDTVSIRVHNTTGGAIDPASAVWHIHVGVH